MIHIWRGDGRFYCGLRPADDPGGYHVTLEVYGIPEANLQSAFDEKAKRADCRECLRNYFSALATNDD